MRCSLKIKYVITMLLLASLFCAMGVQALAEEESLAEIVEEEAVEELVIPCTGLNACPAEEGKHAISCEKAAAYIGENQGYEKISNAVLAAQDGKVYLKRDCDLRFMDIGSAVLDTNGFTLYGDVVGTVYVNHGRWYTADGTYLVGPADHNSVNPPKYESYDALIETHLDGSQTIVSGTVSVANIWRVSAGQKLVVSEGARLVVDQGRTFCVYGTAEIYGQAEFYGTVQLGNESQAESADSVSITAAPGLIVTSGISGHSVVYDNGRYTLKADTTVAAAIGERRFSSVQQAVDAAYAGETVTLLNSHELENQIVIPQGKELSLNLNGQSLSQLKFQTSDYSMLVNYGTLTIFDSASGGRLSYTDIGEGGEYGSNTIENYGVLNITGGMILNESDEDLGRNGYPHAIDSYGIVYISGGEVRSNEYSAIRVHSVADGEAYLDISGGTVKGCIDIRDKRDENNCVRMSVSGGSLYACSSESVVRFINHGGDEYDSYSVEFSGGYVEAAEPFTVKRSGDMADVENITVVRGGKFTCEIGESFLHEDFQLMKTPDNKFLVAVKG